MWRAKYRDFKDGRHEDVFPGAEFGTYASVRFALEQHLGLPAGSDEVFKEHWFLSDGWFSGVEVGAEEYAGKHGWTKVGWDGNLELNLACWRKKFGRGHVSVGCGKFELIVHSFGADSDDSFSSTRWRRKTDNWLTEAEAMKETDHWWNVNRFRYTLKEAKDGQKV